MKKMIIASLMGANLLNGGLLQATQNGENDGIQAICATANIECLMSDAGVVVGRPGSTALYAEGIDRAAESFQRYFGQIAPQAAVVLGEVADADIRASLLKAYPVVLPWLTIKDREAMVARSVRAQITRQYPDMDAATLNATVERSVQASLNANGGAGHSGGGASEDVHQGVFAHELGHLFFVRTFWPDENMNIMESRPANVSRYAGPGPDWLDEMSAVLMENEALTQGRITGLNTVSENQDFSKMWPLDDYFTIVHPAFEQARAMIAARQRTAEGRAQGNVVILSREDLNARDDGRSPAMFYSQSRGFADYMIETTGNEQIFAEIAKHIAAGGDMISWLEKVGKNYGLEPTIEGLETEFHSWLTERYEDSEVES